MQPFSRAYFPRANAGSAAPDSDPKPVAEVLRSGQLFTFEREWRTAHLADADSPDQPQAPLAYQAPEEPITLHDLAQFLKKPIDTFFQHRLRVRFEAVEEDDTDNENFDLTGLDRWRLDTS